MMHRPKTGGVGPAWNGQHRPFPAAALAESGCAILLSGTDHLSFLSTTSLPGTIVLNHTIEKK